MRSLGGRLCPRGTRTPALGASREVSVSLVRKVQALPGLVGGHHGRLHGVLLLEVHSLTSVEETRLVLLSIFTVVATCKTTTNQSLSYLIRDKQRRTHKTRAPTSRLVVIKGLAVGVVMDQRPHEVAKADLAGSVGAQKLQEASCWNDPETLRNTPISESHTG